MGIPIEIMYIIALLAVIVIVFVAYKRPIYEAMAIGYIAMVAVTGRYDLFWKNLIKPSTNTLFYAICAFLILAFIFGETNVVDSIIKLILALVGRIKGGAGLVSLLSSTFMAALSGTGPGNVAATGVFTIPAMIRTGFPRPLAATVEMSASSLGPMIPPSGTILLAFAALEAFMPDKFTLSKFWMVVWAIGIWFILQRLITLMILCKKYKVEAMPADMIPSLKETFKDGWKALIIPLLIFIPLFVDAQFGELLKLRIGTAGAKAFSSSVILFTPGIAAIYAILISRKKIKEKGSGSFRKGLGRMFTKAYTNVIPVAATIFFAYSISFIFGDINLGNTLKDFIQTLGFTKLQLSIFIPVFAAFLGMVLPGSSQIAIFGGGMIAGLVSAGVNPMLAAAILPAITGAQEGMTPPLALCMYTAMGIAESKFVETTKMTFVWVLSHLVVSILIILGLLPLFIV